MKLYRLRESLSDYNTTGWKIRVSAHAKERADKRFPDKNQEDWHAFHRNVVHGLIGSKERNSGTHLIFSKSHNHAVVAHVDRRKKEVRYITVPPHGKDHATHKDDTKILVENFVIEHKLLIS